MHPGINGAERPDKPAYIMASTGEVVTHGDLDRRSNKGAHYFRSLGLQHGDAIAICMENNRHFLEICWAAHRAGLYYACTSSYLTAPEVAYIVNDCAAQVFISSVAKADVAKDVPVQTPNIHTCLMVGDPIEGFEDWDAAIADMPDTPIADEWEGHDMLYSSGTTGRPKGIKIDLENRKLGEVRPSMQAIMALYGISEETIYLSPAPLYHAAPLRYNLLMNRVGATTIIMERFDPERALQLIEEHRVTHSQWVPTMFVRFMKLPEEVRAKYDVSSMKVAIHAAAPCPVEVKQAMMDWWGPVIYEYYAGTEGSGFVAANPQEWLAHPGTVGRAIVGELKIMDQDNPEIEVPQGEIGQIFFANGPAFAYHNDAQKTAESRNSKGWTTLGDIGYLTDDGFLHLTDRKAFMIISGGVNIYPQEIEDRLITHPDVMDAAVIGVPDKDFGEAVKGVVQLKNTTHAGDAMAEKLIAWCRAELSAIKTPKSIDFMDELPRHANGKLYKRLLKDRYWGKKDSRII
ncbi:AMP-binding protein [Minwuia sp.]|uniref:AMP-binding protein n=1 Tax=Minwuia sp. TaxID=2493630 RepID=UPI003A93ED96